jgi:DNA protecting protein DprA
MNTPEGRAWQALAQCKGIGAKAQWQLADYLVSRQRTASWLLGHPDKVREALGNRSGIVLPDANLLKTSVESACEDRRTIVLHPLHPLFPGRIRELKDKLPLPAVLYAAGNLALLERPGVAIVGRRHAAETALAAAAELASQLSAKGVTVTSGYASGIDSAAHLGALRSGGTTIVVLAEGLGRFQVKAEFRGLLTEENALLVSQFAPGEKWASYQAMARNKLVAALAHALVVIVAGAECDDSGRHSGTFDAGMSALQLGLPLFVALPAFFAAPPAGNLELIRRGGRAWDPAVGCAPIISAILAPTRPSGQRRLF